MVDESTKHYIENKAAEFVAECPWFSLRKASRIATQVSNDLLQESGLRITQLGVLVVIAVAETTTVTHLAEELVMDQSTLSRNLKPLERDGLIQILPGEVDRRTRIISLTEKGREALVVALPLWEQAKNAIGALFGAEHVESLLELVTMLSELSNPE